MPWNLRIRTFDVDQGESSFFLAWNPDTPENRSLLIDGGLRMMSRVVNQKVENEFNVVFGNHRDRRVNGVVVTHYDNDHMRGIASLLNLDNLYVLFDLVASYAAQTASLHPNPLERLAAVTGTTLAVFLGAYNMPPLPPAMNPTLININTRAVQLVQQNPACTPEQAQNYGVQAVIDVDYGSFPGFQPIYNVRLFPLGGQGWNRLINLSKAMSGNFQHFIPHNAQDFIDEAINTAFVNLGAYLHLNQEGHYLTYGRYRNSYVISPLPTQPLNNFYVFFDHAANGFASINGQWIRVPGVNRQRIQAPNLGQEILWNGAGHMNNAPEIYVCARNRLVWNPPAGATQIGLLAINDNYESIAMVVRFNSFWFYTGGDLPSDGEEQLVNNLIHQGIQRPGGVFPFPGRFAAFKCGHHGSSASTSTLFLQRIHSRVAVISCGGTNQFIIHDAQIIGRLNANLENQRYCLTGASDEFVDTYLRPPTKGRVAGTYVELSSDILINITQAQSEAVIPNQRFFTLHYMWISLLGPDVLQNEQYNF